jgi:NADPH:quinone reductase-like Zn-dependent oxidoreductase
MKAVALKEFGGPENLSLGDLPIPSVEPGTVLIRTIAVWFNLAAWHRQPRRRTDLSADWQLGPRSTIGAAA